MPVPLGERPLLPRADAPAYRTHEVHPGVFSAAQCRRIVELGTTLPVDGGGLEGSEGQLHDESLRSADVAWLSPGPETEWIFTKLAAVALRANRRYRFELTGFEEDLQFTRYDRPGAFYTWHQDGLDGPVAHRKLSLVVQLSDPHAYEGADLELFQTVEDLDEVELAELGRRCRARGTVVAFPSFEYHRVTPLLTGERHSLVAWLSGPPFR